MKSPLHSFLDIAKALAVKPLSFWQADVQKKYLQSTIVAIQKLKGILEKKAMKDTHAYKALLALEEQSSALNLNEVPFIQALYALTEIYIHGKADEKTKELVSELEREVGRAKKRVLEYHVILEALHKKAVKLTEKQQVEADLATLQNVGVFYVLEYTLQVLALWSRLNDKGKTAILHDGLSAKEGNLPAYLPLEDTFRKDFCLKIFNQELRTALLTSFYKFEEVFYTEDIKKIGPALKDFNLSLLHTFERQGLKIFKGLIYKPFGSDISMAEIREIINHSM